MGLSNREYDIIMASYDAKRIRNERIHDDRIIELKEKVDGYEAILDEIAQLRSKRLKMSIEGMGDDPSLKERELSLYKNREELLVSAGFPADYDQPIYDCDKCRDTGWINEKRERCSCFIKEKTRLLFEDSGLNGLIDSQNFDTIDFSFYEGEDLEAFKKAVNIAKDFSDGFGDTYDNLLLYGNVGTGKTFLSCCVAKAVMEKGYSVSYLSADKIFKTLIDLRFDNENEEFLRIKEAIEESDLLIIDDLGTEVTGERSEADLFSCLNGRNLKKQATVISTNLMIDELGRRYSERILSRLTNGFTFCKFTGKDIRLIKKMDKMRK